jgi:hypothetical protein
VPVWKKQLVCCCQPITVRYNEKVTRGCGLSTQSHSWLQSVQAKSPVAAVHTKKSLPSKQKNSLPSVQSHPWLRKESPPVPGGRPPQKESHTRPRKIRCRPRKVTCGCGPSTQSHPWLWTVRAMSPVATVHSRKVTRRKKVTDGVKSICGGKCTIGWSGGDRPMHRYHCRHPTILHIYVYISIYI